MEVINGEMFFISKRCMKKFKKNNESGYESTCEGTEKKINSVESSVAERYRKRV